MTPPSVSTAGIPGGNLGGISCPWVGTGRIAYVDATAGIDTTGVDTPAVEVSFDTFDDLAARVAGGLAARGLTAAARVGLLADNSVAYGACYLGIPRAGMATVPLNTRQSPENLRYVADDAELTLVIHDAANAHLLPPNIAAIELGTAAWETLVANDQLDPVTVDADDIAVQMYTSGSTGKPKGVLLSHGGQLFSIEQYLTGVLPMDPDERLMVSAPMYHKNAGMQLKMAITLGGTVILLNRFNAAEYLRTAAAHRATAVSGVPTMFALMAAETELVPTLDLSSVVRASIGSAPMTPTLHAQASELFPAATVTNGYGTTEAVAVFGGHPDGKPRPTITVGHPLASVETRLVDSTGSDAQPDPVTGRRQGELWVRSRGLMMGYHGLEALTAERVTDGWYHTGDVMEADEDGWHYFVGRVDDMFNCGGENVYPGDVEQLLERCPGIHQAAVVPVDDELKGALPVAFVVADAGASIDEPTVKTWSLEHGPAYQHPRAVWFVDEIPLAGTAKIDKHALTIEAASRWTPR
ncbi:MAG: class I adenylate-forming enzyme family protein [Acidimicrobiales bacterium]